MHILNLIILSVIIFLSIICLALFGKIQITKYTQKLKYNKLIPLAHAFFSSNFLCQKNYLNFYSEILRQTALPYASVQNHTVPIFTRYSLLAINATLIFSLFEKNFLILAIFYMLADTLLNYQLYEKVNSLTHDTLTACRQLCVELRQHYSYLNDVGAALAHTTSHECLDAAVEDLGRLMNGSSKIRGLDALLVKYKLDVIRLIFIICDYTKEKGDTKTRDGLSAFATSLDLLTMKITSTISEENLRFIKFNKSKVTYIVTLFMILIMGLSAFMEFILPGLGLIKDGSIGFLLKAYLLWSASVETKKIAFINRKPALDVDERTKFQKKFAENSLIKKIVKLVYISPKEGRRIQVLLRETFSTLTLESIQFKILQKSLQYFIIALLLSLITITMTQISTRNSIVSISIVKVPMTEKQEVHLKNINKIFLERNKKGGLSEDEIAAIVSKELKGLTTDDLAKEVSRLKVKALILDICSFNLLFLLVIPSIVALRAKKVVIKELAMRRVTLNSYQEESILALIISVVMVMNMNIETADLLKIMRSSTDIYSNILDKTFHRFIGKPETALFKLKNSIKNNNFEFKQLISRLILTISSLSARDAFANMDKEFTNFLNKKEQISNDKMDINIAKATRYSTSFMTKSVFVYIVAPLFLLAGSLLVELFNNSAVMELMNSTSF